MRKIWLHAAACALVLVCASGASAAANFVYHEQTNNYVATPTCPSSGTDTAAGRYVENTDRSGAAGFQIYSPEPYSLKHKVEYQFFTNQWRVFYTTDGSTPTVNDNCSGGACNPTPAGTTQSATGTFVQTYQDQTQGCQPVDVVAASIPPQPAGTTVKYIVAAWHSGGGDVIYANSGECSTCFECNSGTSGCAMVYQYSVLSAPAAPLIISEFRWGGSNGASDEFIEIYNNSDSEVEVSTLDGSAGYAVAKSPGTTLFFIPNGTRIPARAHYLGCNSTPAGGYSLAAYPAGNGTTAICDATYTGADALPLNTGIALFRTSNPANFTAANRLDAVGTTSESNTLYKEGAGVYPLTTLTTNNSYFRSERYGLPSDTGDNGADFIWADTGGNCAIDPPGTTCVALDGTRRGRHIGSPGPENSSSPIVRNTTAPATLLAPCVSNTVAPNRMRTTSSVTNGFYGTIAFRRTITNTSTSTITRLRFRLVDLSIFPDGNFTGSPNADLRAMTSSLSTEPNPCGGGSVTIQGLRLEEASPVAPNNQPNGGGFNSTLSADSVTTITPLRPGDSINVSFLFGIQSKGNARFWFNIEMLP